MDNFKIGDKVKVNVEFEVEKVNDDGTIECVYVEDGKTSRLKVQYHKEPIISLVRQDKQRSIPMPILGGR